jgi:hypothetical protein
MFCLIPGFRHEADDIYTLLGYYETSNGNTAPNFRDSLSVPSSSDFVTLEDGTDRLSRNFGTELPFDVS